MFHYNMAKSAMFITTFVFNCIFSYVSALTWVPLSKFDCMNGIVNLGNYGQTHVEPSGMRPVHNCEVLLKVNETDRMMLFFEKLNVSGNCGNRWLELHDGKSRQSPYIGTAKFCGDTKPGDVFITNGRFLKLYFQGNWSVDQKEFALWITTFHTGTCSSDEFKCGNGRCIDRNLRCFGENPCGDNSDCNYFRLSGTAVAGIVAGGAMLAIIIVAVMISCHQWRSTRANHRRQTLTTAQQNIVSAATCKPSYGYDQPVPKFTKPLTMPPTPTPINTASE